MELVINIHREDVSSMILRNDDILPNHYTDWQYRIPRLV